MDNITMHKCSKCGIEKEFTEEFFPYRFDKHGKILRKECRVCWLARNKEYKRAKSKTYGIKPICSICGKEFEGKTNNKYCSNKCKNESKRIYYHENNSASLNDYTFKKCEWCGKEFEINTFIDVRKYCSSKCNRGAYRKKYVESGGKADESRRRRARIKGTKIEKFRSIDIYERDGFVCQLCGKKVDMKKKSPHPMSPTIDHIIPLSKGGTHERKNVQLAHFICNSLKSDRYGGQLRLF